MVVPVCHKRGNACGRVHSNLIGRYERQEAIPSVGIAAKIASELNVSLDYLIGLSEFKIDSTLLNRIKEIATLSEDEQKQLYAVIDAVLRDYKARKAYLSKWKAQLVRLGFIFASHQFITCILAKVSPEFKNTQYYKLAKILVAILIDLRVCS